MRSLARKSERSLRSLAHMDRTWPLAEVMTSGGCALPRRASAAPTMNSAESLRSMTASGSPPIETRGMFNSCSMASTREDAAMGDALGEPHGPWHLFGDEAGEPAERCARARHHPHGGRFGSEQLLVGFVADGEIEKAFASIDAISRNRFEDE